MFLALLQDLKSYDLSKARVRSAQGVELDHFGQSIIAVAAIVRIIAAGSESGEELCGLAIALLNVLLNGFLVPASKRSGVLADARGAWALQVPEPLAHDSARSF